MPADSKQAIAEVITQAFSESTGFCARGVLVAPEEHFYNGRTPLYCAAESSNALKNSPNLMDKYSNLLAFTIFCGKGGAQDLEAPADLLSIGRVNSRQNLEKILLDAQVDLANESFPLGRHF